MDDETTVNRSYRIKRTIMDEVTDDLLAAANCRSVNEFVGDAIAFYTEYLKSSRHNRFLAKEISTVIQGRFNMHEDRIENALFKLAVLIYACLYIHVAEGYLTERSFNDIIKRCIEDVKGLNGFIDFKKMFNSISWQ